MKNRKVSIGLDYGTESARALIVDVLTGEEIATATANFPTGVMDKTLPDGTELEPETALQNPNDYLEVMEETLAVAMEKGKVSAEQVIGLAIDFTASTVLP